MMQMNSCMEYHTQSNCLFRHKIYLKLIWNCWTWNCRTHAEVN